MNNYPFWKNILVALVVATGILYALPNLFGDDQAVQVTSRNDTLDESILPRLESILSDAGFSDTRLRFEQGTALALFDNEEDQLRAKDAIDAALNETTRQHIVALNLVSAAPDWLRSIAKPMYLGLDLRGGVHFLMEVDMESALNLAEERYVAEWKTLVRRANHRGSVILHKDGQLSARFKEGAIRDEMLAAFQEEGRDLDFTVRDETPHYFIEANLTDEAADAERRTALQQNVVTLRNRVNELGVAEPIIQQQGLERIVVQLPGIQDPGRAREILGATATLEYRLVHGSATDWFAAESGGAPAGTEAVLHA